MSTSTEVSELEELRSRRSDLQQQIQGLIDERDKLYNEFQERMDSAEQPSEDEVARFEARRNHEDVSIRPTEKEVKEFEERINAGPTEENVRRFNTEHSERRKEIKEKMGRLSEVTDRIDEQGSLERSRNIAERASAGLEHNKIENQRDPLTYRQDNQNRHSYFLDLAAMTHPDVRSRDFRMEGFEDRLTTHAKEMADLLPQRWDARKRQAESRIELAETEFRNRVGISRGGFDRSPFERHDPIAWRRERDLAELEQRAPSRIVGQGGYAIPPLWLTSISHVAA